MSAPKNIRPCEGGAPALAPVRLGDLVKPAAAAPADAAPARPAYVPPSLRKAEEAKPKTGITSAEMSDQSLFPTLGATPKATGASWGALRNRLVTAAAPAAPERPPDLSSNQFAALDEDAAAAPAPPPVPSAGPVSFKKVLEDRIKQDEEEAAAAAAEAALPETEDPLEMTPEQLVKNGWARIHRPFGSQPDRLQGLTALREWLATRDWTEKPDPLVTDDGETFTWDDMTKLRQALEVPPDQPESSQRVLELLCRPAAAGKNPWENVKPVEETIAFREPKIPKGLADLLARKKAHRAQHGPGAAELRAAGRDIGPVGSEDAARASQLRAF
jgi:hypothetical protein